ncbi:inactive histone-lysine N-methyltransferase 2E-like isoform X2 [Patiria miniata]|uniref:SET domain-containing protein n=1 Tax=Patiria miniata TaxID=46514 RepID=A0A913ZT86_PATMI|nr:inactive histone-lysine N-methyltransferase 2E-like isoform X2 [Patiria miniata]
MSNILVYDGALTDKNYAAMAAGSDPEPVEQPVATGDVTSHPAHTAHTTTHYIGLPYQDHNYGAPPPPTPPESPSPVPLVSPVPTKVNGIFDDPLNLEVKLTVSPPEQVESKDEGVTRCICNFEHDDGYMICCDHCCVWQHVDCMGLERDNIPETFYCEKCQPREVDRQRAVALQSKKRAVMSDDSSSESGDEVPNMSVGSAATYTAISNSPTSLTLTTHNKHKKMKKKKKKRCKEKEEDKHHKKRKKHHSKKCNKSDMSEDITAPMELDIMDEEALPAWNDSEATHDRYEEAVCNQYSADIQHIISSQAKGPKPDPSPFIITGLPLPSDPLVNLSRFGRSASSVGIAASENLRSNDCIVEYWGKVMLKEQLEGDKTFFKRHYPFVLFYSKFNNVDICVDARNYGNVARFVRRSCSPNAEVRHYVENNVLHFCLFALLGIPKKTEVTIGFDFSYMDCSYPVHCACSKKNCIVKRHFRKQNSQVTPAKTPLINHLQDSSSLSVSSNLSKKRTVSPLRVSLSAHNAQNQAQPLPTTNGDESSHLTPSNPETSPARPTNSDTSAEVETEGSEENRAETKLAPEAAKKMTREERKMEAILQAFARMEKTEKRRKEALERTAGNKAAVVPVMATSMPTTEANSGTKTPTNQSEEKQVEKEDAGFMEEDSVGKADCLPSATPDEVASVEVIALDSAATPTEACTTSAVNTSSVNTMPAVTTRTKGFKGRKRKGARRRSRVNSGASTVSVDFSSHDEESNPPTCPLSTSLPAVSLSSNPAPLLIQTVFSPSQGTDQQGMASPVPACSKHFKFPKTKKFFMNEWLNEKAQEASATKPLTIKTEPADIISPSHSSPGSVLHLNTSREPRGNLEASFGSAKKRWLRQAMSESNGPGPKTQTSSSNNSGSESPLCNGTLSPNPASYPVSPALSPNTSASNDMMTPLKKRMLRHSIAEDRLTTTPPPAAAQIEDKLHPHRTSTAEEDAPAATTGNGPEPSTVDTPRKPESGVGSLPGLIGPSAQGQTEPLVSPECAFDIRRRSLAFPFPLPARKDFRKSSSVDSGLSVTTPADFDRSPISLLPGEQHEASTAPVKDEGTPVKDELHMRQTMSENSGELDSQRQIDAAVLVGVPQERREDSDRSGLNDPKTDASRVSSVSEKAVPGGFQGADGHSGSSEEIATAASRDAPLRLDFSLSASQGSLASSLQSTQSSLPDLHKSCMSLPDLGRSRTSLPDLSHSASSAELQLSSVARKLDMKSDLYSTQRISGETVNQTQMHVSGDVPTQRIRHLSGCNVNSGTSADQTEGQLPQRPNFAEDQVPGNLYSSFGSPLKRPLLGQSPERSSNVDRMQPTASEYNPNLNSVVPPMNVDAGSAPLDQMERREGSQTYLQPLDGPNAADSESPVTDLPMRGSTWSQLPNSGQQTGPGRPPSGPAPLPTGVESRKPENYDEPRPGYRPASLGPNDVRRGPLGESGQMGPGRPLAPGQAAPFGVPPSPVKPPLAQGVVRPGGIPLGPSTPPAGLVSPVPGTPPAAKKRVSLLEYRKRKGSDLGNSKTAKKESPASAPCTPVAPKPPLVPLKPPLPSPISTSNPNTPTKPLESPLKAGGSDASTPTAQLPNLPLFTTEKENGIGERLSLTTEAQQVISSLTSLLKKHKKPEEESAQEPKWSSSRLDTSDEDPLQKMRKELKEKNRERERKEALAHKRPRSPDPPPPPPSKRPNPGLRLQIPPPPPPKTKTDTRSGDISGESTPVKMPNPAANTTPVRTPGSAGIYPQLGKAFNAQAASPYLPAGVNAPFQQPYQAQQYPQQQQQQQQQQPPQPQHQSGYSTSYPVYDYNHQKSHAAQQQFPQYYQGQQQSLTQQGQYQQQQQQQGYQNPYPQAQKQGYQPAAVAVQPQQQQQQPYPKAGSKFGSNPNVGTKGAFGADGRTSKPSFPTNANSYSPRRGNFYK